MTLNTSKCNYPTPLHFKGLTSHSTNNRSLHRWVFQGINCTTKHTTTERKT